MRHVMELHTKAKAEKIMEAGSSSHSMKAKRIWIYEEGIRKARYLIWYEQEARA